MKISIRPIRTHRGTENPLDHYPKGMYAMDCVVQTPNYTDYANTLVTLQFDKDGDLIDYITIDACPKELHVMIGDYITVQAQPLKEYILLLKLKLIVDSVVKYDDCEIKLKEI